MKNVIIFDRMLDLKTNTQQSAFLFGPRGTGKSTWIQHHLPDALVINLLKSSDYIQLLADPSRIEQRIPPSFQDWIVLDEVQKIPTLLNEVHRLIESHGHRFLLTGSSARSLRKKGVNLLAGRALNYKMHPLTCYELADRFDLKHALKYGLLPFIYHTDQPNNYLASYVKTYLREEVLQEGLTRHLDEFARFLEIASFSQGSVLNHSEIAREAAIDRRTVKEYFEILNDLLIGVELPIFTKRAKRRVISHSKFYFFDVGVYQILRPKGLLDSIEEIGGIALETLFFQHLRALNDYKNLSFSLYFWRTSEQHEVDFILYGEQGFYAFEIKHGRHIKSGDLKSLRLFISDYPNAKAFLLYGGDHRQYIDNIEIIPFVEALYTLPDILTS